MTVLVLYTNRKSILLSPVSIGCNLHSHRRFHQFSPRSCGSAYEKCYNVELVVNINKEYHSVGGGNSVVLDKPHTCIDS